MNVLVGLSKIVVAMMGKRRRGGKKMSSLRPFGLAANSSSEVPDCCKRRVCNNGFGTC